MQKLFVVILVTTFFNFAAHAQNNSWLKTLTKIKPLESTEKDVEEILGRPKDRYSNIGEYKIEDGEVSVIYSEGKCKSNSASEFDVEKGTVTSLDFTPKKIIKFSSLNLDLTNYVKEDSSDVVDSLDYSSSGTGISFFIRRKDILDFVQFSGDKNTTARQCSEVFVGSNKP
jgi:hypothetical protein